MTRPLNLPPEHPVRVRIAPSPTGNLHVGTARTALFNYMFAKRHNGQFILRIEDTDLSRSKPEYKDNIFKSLQEIGLNWDEGPDIGGDYGPYKQSERLPVYKTWAEKLIAADFAYYSYETQAELDAAREKAQAEKRPNIYNGACRDPEIRKTLSQQPDETGQPRKPSLRFKIPKAAGTLTFKDLVRGDVSFDTALLGDFVIMKSDGTPSYNFAVVVDDITMAISHIIRGEDHISNTPRQILLYNAFETPLPQFAHVGMILASDRSKLSKRHGAVAVSDYIAQGYLPESFCNFMALMGWSPPDGEEVAALSHFIAQFSLERITHSPAVFEMDKLNFLNGKRIRTMAVPELLLLVQPYLTQFDLTHYPNERLLQILEAVREPLTRLNEFPDAVSYFFGRAIAIEATLIDEVLTGETPHQVLTAFQLEFMPTAAFDNQALLTDQLKAFTKQLKPIKVKTIMWAIRAALTGRVHGAELSTILFILGKETVAHRLNAALALCLPTEKTTS
ncbi:MAG: glutamate--tRNA ligase [Cyanobacteria bacterium P01_H01_bin.74]